MDDEPTFPPSVGSQVEGADGLDRRRQREASTGDGTAAEAEAAEVKVKSQTRNMLEWVAVIVGAIVIAVVVRTFILQTFWIPSPSMSPTLVENDRVLVNKLSYKLHDINRGDVIVFGRPPTEEPSEIKDLIKRVIALPGESVSVMDSKVYVDGRELEEPYINDLPTLIQDCPTTFVPGIDTPEGFEVPEGTVLVMGDNRTNSRDGRCFGPVDEDLVVGRAFFIMWPPSNAGGL